MTAQQVQDKLCLQGMQSFRFRCTMYHQWRSSQGCLFRLHRRGMQPQQIHDRSQIVSALVQDCTFYQALIESDQPSFPYGMPPRQYECMPIDLYAWDRDLLEF